MSSQDTYFYMYYTKDSHIYTVQASPRKKFKCPTCTSEESLWSDPQHYLERNECINVFQGFFLNIPLQTVKFRLDPVLYKVDSSINRYPNMGDL